jgi:hypothetical protein
MAVPRKKVMDMKVERLTRAVCVRPSSGMRALKGVQ